MKKENITLLESTENGMQVSRASRKEHIPISDKRLEVIFQCITKIIIIIMLFLLAGTIIVTADALKLGIIGVICLFVVMLHSGLSD